jgi:dolichyl-phosphate-mannose--protein O-mannosyl transferase
VLPFLLFDSVPDVLWLCLVGLVYLSWVEVRREPDLMPQAKLWWCLLVFLKNVPGYVALRIWVAIRRRRRAEAARA